MADFHRPMRANYETFAVLRKPTPQIGMACFDTSLTQRKLLCDRRRQDFYSAAFERY
jgi:hypothetical protein